jgi:hypothetical protein
MPTKVTPTVTPTGELALYIVRESFLGSDGTIYAKGQVIHPDDLHIKLMPERFAPFEFPHPVRRGRAITTPEVRA